MDFAIFLSGQSNAVKNKPNTFTGSSGSKRNIYLVFREKERLSFFFALQVMVIWLDGLVDELTSK